MRHLSTTFAVLLVVAVFMLASPVCMYADTLDFLGTPNGASYTFGTVNSSGGTTVIATGLSLGGAIAPKLMFAPNGTLYEFDVGPFGPNLWGTMDTATGAFTKTGSLATAFAAPQWGNFGFNESNGCSLAFGPSGILYATGPDISNNGSMDFGTLNLTTGAFTKISSSPVELAGSIAEWGNTTYFIGTPNGASYTFGTVNSSGGTTVIATGLSLGGAIAPKLMFAPNGTLYEFDVGPFGPNLWGTMDTATGALTKTGSLAAAFAAPQWGNFGFNESNGCSLAFGPSGILYATGPDISNNGSMDFGTLNLTTGAFTKISSSPVELAGSIAVPTPEPSTFALVAAGAIVLVGYGLRRRRNKRRTAEFPLNDEDDTPAVLSFASKARRRAA